MTVYIGIDWSEQQHAVCFLNEAGAVIRELTISHRVEGLEEFDQARMDLGVKEQEVQIGLETAHNLLIDFLVDRGYSRIYVLPPFLVKHNAGRYSQGSAKDDRRDARLIADILRTDHGRLHAWRPDSLLTRQLQSQVRYLLYLKRMIRRQANYLRALLVRYYPAALHVFSSLEQPISLAFLQQYPTPQAARALSYEAFQAFLRRQHHPQPKKWPDCYARLNQAFPAPNPDTVTLYAQRAQQLAAFLLPYLLEYANALQHLNQLFAQHPSAGLFRSLPGAGDFLAPALLAKLGDDRQRFPTHAVLQATAGTCPITYRSGRSKSVRFRVACDREFRYIAQQWALQAISHSAWAESYYQALRKRGLSRSDATRRVANRLLAILWKLWQTQQPYEERIHLQNRLARAKPRT